MFSSIFKTINMAKVTNKQFKEWQEKYGDIYDLPVDDKVGHLRVPNMTDYKMAFTQMQKNGDIAFGESMLRSLWLGGDEEILNEDGYFLSARKVLMDFLEYEEPIITKLENNRHEIEINEKKCVVRLITRDDIKIAEKKNPSSKPFVTQEKLFELVKVEADEAYLNKQNPAIRFPLYKALEQLQNQKVALLKKRSVRLS